ncbi:GhoT/OrtT family toxin [Yersinia enterocolitica]|nr:GhoT/OrtT family toxin [Yersinia enterocolitica]
MLYIIYFLTRNNMSGAVIMIIIYLSGGLMTSIFIYFISQEQRYYRILGSVLTGLTWPLSLIPALLFSIL